MPTYYELLKHPNWQKRRLEILQFADFTCTDCGSKDKTLHVHHCYYEKGKKPWEYPLSALRCLCEDCHKSAEQMRLSMAKILSEVSAEDQVYGYALGAYAYSEQDEIIYIPNYEVACGVADYWGVNVDAHLIPHLTANNAETCGRGLLQLVASVGSPTKPYLEGYAQCKLEA